MFVCRSAVLFVALSALAMVVFLNTALWAQPPQDVKAKEGLVKQIDLETMDRVELKAKYFPGKASSPCVLMLHALGDSSSDKEWINLAKKLQAKGFAVFMFDFRGHGDSTTVKPGTPYNPKNPKQATEKGFWDEVMNQRGIKGFVANKPRPTEIKYEQFTPGYSTVLANDIAAAKSFLDEQPDCNSSNLVVLGANDGALLAALWINSEWNRYRYFPPALGRPQGAIDRQNPEGMAIKAAVFLSASSTLGTSKTSYQVWPMLERASKLNKMPTLFVYGEGDSKGKGTAELCAKYLSTAVKGKKEPSTTTAMQIAGAEKMSGKKLLFDSLPTSGKILEFLEGAVDMQADPKNRRVTDDDFVWEWNTTGQVQTAVARRKGNNRIEFSSYASFLK